MQPLLEIDNLHTEFRTGAGIVRAVDGVSYSVDAGETVAVVSEKRVRQVREAALSGIATDPEPTR